MLPDPQTDKFLGFEPQLTDQVTLTVTVLNTEVVAVERTLLACHFQDQQGERKTKFFG